MTATLYWQATHVEVSAEQNGSTSFPWTLALRAGSEKPRHIFIAFQLSSRRNSQKQTPMIFDALKLTDIRLNVNGQVIPSSDLDLNFGERRYHRAYKMLTDYMGKDQNVDSGFQISAENFRTRYPIYHFDLEKHSENLKSSISDIQVQAKFSEAPGKLFRAYAVIQSDRTMLLESDGRKMHLTNSN